MKKYVLDLGSSTLKLYEFNGQTLRLAQQSSLHFKKQLQDGVLAEPALTDLVRFIKSAGASRRDLNIYATAFFRKLPAAERSRIVEHVFSQSGHLIQIIDQTAENIFLELALTRNLRARGRFLAVNVGGGSTELIIFEAAKRVRSINVDVGVGGILQKYPGINADPAIISLESVVADVLRQLPAAAVPVKHAFLTGGELTYMRVAGYPLVPNNLFEDENHPVLISTKLYEARNAEIFSAVTLSDLEALLPENPQWMHGARAYCAIAQAICRHFGVTTVIPSDVNIAHGIAHYLWGY